MQICLTGARIIDPSRQIDRYLNLTVSEGKILSLSVDLPAGKAQVIDLSGKIIVPGFIDLHVHLREPGYTDKETILSGSSAAAAGGVTTVFCMPNTSPPIDSAEVAELVKNRADAAGLVRVIPVGTLTRGRCGLEPADFKSLYAAGIRAFSDDGSPVADSGLLYRIFKELSRYDDIVVFSHSEDLSLSRGGVIHEGFFSKLLKQKGIPEVAETAAVARDILLAQAAGVRLHLAHISTAASAELVAWAKEKGLPVTAEVTPHHLLLTDAAVKKCGALAKVNPPLRPEKDRLAMCSALRQGIIDIIATDHAPHQGTEKELPLQEAPFGITGLETAVPLLLSGLVQTGLLKLSDLVNAFSCSPARLMGLKTGTLSPGAPADLTVLDPEAKTVVDPARFYSQAKHSPFAGWELTGAPVLTIVGGSVIMKQGEVLYGTGRKH